MESVTCKICRRQFARYTCPTCNVPYCSLTCFRSVSHAQCSETFYRKEIESDIPAQSSKSAVERLKMMDVLRRFEEENPESEMDSFQVEAEDDTDLARRLQSVDLESTSSNALWSMLTSEERTKFLKALNNPSSELAQQLLASEELEKERKAPWWEATGLEDDEVQSDMRHFGGKPDTMQIPPDMIKPPKASKGFLIYNFCAICIAYGYTTRYLSASPLSSLTTSENLDAEARRILSQLLPFLADRKARTLHTSLSSVVTDIWSRFDAGVMTASYLAILLRDAAHLLRPASLTVLSQMRDAGPALLDLDAHPHNRAILVLSDLSKLFRTANPTRDQNHITMKLLFYAAHVVSVPSSVLSSIADEAMARSTTIGNETVISGDSPDGRITDMPARNLSPDIRLPSSKIKDFTS